MWGNPWLGRRDLRGLSLRGRSRAGARYLQVALDGPFTKRRGLHGRAGSRLRGSDTAWGWHVPAAAAPQLTVWSRRGAGESLESSRLAACCPLPCVPARAGAGSQPREGCSGLQAFPALGRRRSGREQLNSPLMRGSWTRRPAAQLSAEHTGPLWPVQGLGARDSQGSLFARGSGI